MKKINIDQIIGHSWVLFKNNWKKLILILAITFGASLLFEGIIYVLQYPYRVWDETLRMFTYDSEPLPIAILTNLLSIFSILVGLWFGATLQKIYLKIVDHKHFVVGDIFEKPTKGMVRYTLVYFVYGFLVVLGLILFIIPGIYLAIRFSFAPILSLDKNLSLGEAFAESTKITEGIKWGILKYNITMILLAVGAFAAGIICLIIGIIPALFIFSGVAGISYAYLYRQMSAHSI